MDSIALIRDNLQKSAERVLMGVEDMRQHALVVPTPRGGAHTLWVLGHLAFIEAQVIHQFARGEEHPFESWQPVFDGDAVSLDAAAYPPFDEVLQRCRAARQSTVDLLDGMQEADLDQASGHTPQGWESSFGTVRLCFQFVSDHWYMHRGQLADARRAAGIDRMWV